MLSTCMYLHNLSLEGDYHLTIYSIFKTIVIPWKIAQFNQQK